MQSASLADVSGWGAMLGRALEETGGALTRKERAWADGILKARAPSRKAGRRGTKMSDFAELDRLS
jgi:hypothetical protein